MNFDVRGSPLVWLASLLLLCLISAPCFAQIATVTTTDESPQLRFAREDLEAALRARNFNVLHEAARPAWKRGKKNVRVMFHGVSKPVRGDSETIRGEGFVLRRGEDRQTISFDITSVDAAGAMYGGLELAEQIRARGIEGVVDTIRNPRMPMRGTKFNIPLDLRNPSYSDMSDSAQANIATVWDFEFWRAYLDALARDRYNFVSLWNLHPFPSMVKVPGYPDVALNDVWRSTIRFDEDYSTRTVGLVTPAMLGSKEVVRQLTIEQKIDFWRRVMQYANDRNIGFYVMTWNVFTYGVDGKYGISDAIDNPKTVDYFRASVREMFRTYPLLRGIGLTAGENMGAVSGEASFQAKENWAFATYGQGVLDAARAEPTRQIRLIHRQHETRAQDIAKTFQPVISQPNVDFVFSFKYAQAHALSSTKQNFHKGYLESLGDLKTLWTIRNDDALMYRWAAPDFVREFIGNIPEQKTQGLYYGSDMWVWGREFLARDGKLSGQLEIDKHWLGFLLWGRLSYDPSLGNERIAELVGLRFPGIDAKEFLRAWQDASMIYPLVTGFHWADFDFQWYIEGCRSRPGPAKTGTGFHSIETFIHQPVHPATDNIPIPAYVEGVIAGSIPPGTTPFQVADEIEARANAASAGMKTFSGQRLTTRQAEFEATVNDLLLMASLGRYYAAKIRGATELALFRETLSVEHRSEATRHMNVARENWMQYTARARAGYRNPLWTNRVGIIDWAELDAEVQRDIGIAAGQVR